MKYDRRGKLWPPVNWIKILTEDVQKSKQNVRQNIQAYTKELSGGETKHEIECLYGILCFFGHLRPYVGNLTLRVSENKSIYLSFERISDYN